ncbi:hypothetical protein POTOM_025437 [Populus tomentosa]|uniref:Uncharacterized protein n=1 Tax=Populus tomentosa TaxID=118781 RepID=A0A8X8CX64_POPTO|nr:hypothetical protein POTOM_025437 [Populus tomentosa]
MERSIIKPALLFTGLVLSCKPHNLVVKICEVSIAEITTVRNELPSTHTQDISLPATPLEDNSTFYCVVIPASVMVPEIKLTKPIAILNAACTPRSLHLLVFWILFENVMSLRRTKAAIIGLLEANRVNEWVVTEKLRNTVRQKNTFKASKKVRSCIGYSKQDLCLGADNGDVYVVLCNLRSTFWERSFLHIFITSSRSFLHNGICQNKLTNLRTGVEACEAD